MLKIKPGERTVVQFSFAHPYYSYVIVEVTACVTVQKDKKLKWESLRYIDPTLSEEPSYLHAVGKRNPIRLDQNEDDSWMLKIVPANVDEEYFAFQEACAYEMLIVQEIENRLVNLKNMILIENDLYIE
jgi:hypothetical protein